MTTFANVPRRCPLSLRQSLMCLILLVGLLQIINTYSVIASSLTKAKDKRKHGHISEQEANRSVVIPEYDNKTYVENMVRYNSSKHLSNSRGERLKEPAPDLRNDSQRALRDNCSECKAYSNLGTNSMMQKLNDTWNFTCNGCYKHAFDYIIPGKHICEGESPIDLIFLITSSHDHAERREVLRKTWLTLVNKTAHMRYAFLLGRTLDTNLHNLTKVENEVHADIIMENFLDTYMNLTYKTRMGLKWVGENCPRARFVMKTDDDMFIDVHQLRKLLQTSHIVKRLENSVMGHCNSHAEPVRDKSSKYYASIVSYPYKTYPPICFGTGYVMSMRNANEIYAISKHVPFFYLEDVFVGMCLQNIRVSIFNYKGFSLIMNEAKKRCRYKHNMFISVHATDDKNVAKLWHPGLCGNLKKKKDTG